MIDVTRICDPEPVYLPGDDFDEPAPTLDPLAELEALDRADWHLQRIGELEHERELLNELYRRKITQLHGRHDEQRAILDRRIAWHSAPIEQLHRRLLELNPRRKTIELPHGASRIRVHKTPKVFIDDQDTVVAWARNSAPDLLPPPTQIRVTDLRSAVTVAERPDGTYAVLMHHGEIVPGVHAELEPPSWRAEAIGGDL